jgi:hypothetical protein
MTSPMKFTHRWFFNQLICCELVRVIVWKRFSGSKWSYGYQRRWFLVIGASSDELACEHVLRPTNKLKLRLTIWCKKWFKRCVSSPRCFWDAWWRRGWSELGESPWIPVITAERERPKSLNTDPLCSIPSTYQVLGARRSSRVTPWPKGWPPSPTNKLDWARVSAPAKKSERDGGDAISRVSWRRAVLL